MDKSITGMITLIARKSQAVIGDVLSKYNITAAEQPFFMALQHYAGATQEELTAIVNVDKAATARVVKSLEKKGYLLRIRDAKDRRKNLIYPTNESNRIVDAVRSDLLHINAQLTKGIDSNSLEIIYAGLQKMETNFSDILISCDAARE